MRNARVDARLDDLEQQLDAVAGKVSGAVGKLLAPLLAEMNAKVNVFNQAADQVNQQLELVHALVDRVEAMGKRLTAQDEHDEFIEGQLDELRVDVTRVAASNETIVQTFSALGRRPA